MIERLFHNWERQLADVSKDRIVRPFDWGLDWLDTPNAWTDGAATDDAAPPLDRISAWVEAALRDSDAFFAVPPYHDWSFTPADPHLQEGGESGTLTFESAYRTPHPENNTVYGRWFPMREEAPLGTPGARRGRAVVVLPQWNSDAEGHVGLARLLARFGVSALRLSLPYHDRRMPPELSRADYIVSSNVVRTAQVCRQAVLDARRAIAWLHAQGFERIGIVGTSLGSCLSMLTAAHEPLVRAAALNHVSPWFADVVWRGLSTRHVRAGLEGHIDLETLRSIWRPISPWSYLDRMRRTPTLLVYARYDLTFPVDLSRVLVREFRRLQLPHEVEVLPCGHYSTGMAPFKFLDAWILTRFLRRAL